VTNTDLLGLGATLAGIMMAVSPFFQIRRMRKTGSSRDFSLLYAALLSVGFVAWLTYGLALGNAPMIVSNLASLSFMAVTIAVALAYRRRPDGRRVSSTMDPEPGTEAPPVA
jgi:MtN3 and saliva related transmembrane protein